jgi:molecular chaperone DnaK
VAFLPSGAVLAGAAAKRRRAIDPRNTIYSAKRLMGQRWLSYATTQFRKSYPFDLIETAQGGCAFQTRGGAQSPIDIGSRLIDKVYAARPALRSDTSAVVAVPTAFESSARDATREAARRAGIDQVSIVDEPIATAIAYGTAHNERIALSVVFDLGGGTFDLAVLEGSGERARVVGHAGDPYLGGDDIDRLLSQWVAAEVLRRHGWDLSADPEVFDRLVVQCERAKVRLGLAQSTQIELAQVDPAAPLAPHNVTLDRAKLSELAQPLVGRTLLLCDQVLREAQLRPQRIEAVYLAGGTTLMPLVRDAVTHYFGRLPHCELDPMEVVAMGASLSGTG